MAGPLDFPENAESLYVVARKINDFMPRHMYNLTVEALSRAGKKLRDSKVAILGWAFINNSDDTRNTPSEPYYLNIMEQGAQVSVHDPYVSESSAIKITQDIEEALKDATAVVIFTGHKQYFELKAGKIRKLTGLQHPVIVDGRNVIDPDAFINEGFIYRGIGRGDKNNHEIRSS